MLTGHIIRAITNVAPQAEAGQRFPVRQYGDANQSSGPAATTPDESPAKEQPGEQSEMVLMPREPTDAMVWAICRASEAMTGECSKCPHEIETPGYGLGIQGCRAIAEEQYHAALIAAEAAHSPQSNKP
jgi:hypothetical protein